MPGRVDLDALGQRMAVAKGKHHARALVAIDKLVLDDIPALVAEVRAARNVIVAARRVSHAVDIVGTTEVAARRLFDLDPSLAAYDQATVRPPRRPHRAHRDRPCRGGLMAERVDLDEFEQRLGTRYGEVVTIKADDMMHLVAELRAAREVVEAAQRYRERLQQPGGGNLTEQWSALCHALDQAVGRPAAADQPPEEVR